MCGRISQARDVMDYMSSIGVPESRIFEIMPPPRRYNVAPGTDVGMVHMFDDTVTFDAVRWGYHTKWAQEKKLPIHINATVEKSRSSYWSSLWKKGRALIPADGWYEWTGDKKNRQPWYIKPKDGKPLWMCALSNYQHNAEEQPYGAGFAILTSDSTGGMVDVHDRRPVILNAEDAKMWIDLSWSREQMEELVRSSALPPDAFEWHQVSKEVNKPTSDGPMSIEPIQSMQPLYAADEGN